MIIGLMGQKNSGKDTVGAYLVKEHKFERRAFADALKRSAGALLDIDFSEIDYFKNQDNVYVTIGYKNTTPVDRSTIHMIPHHMWSPIREQTFRQFLQRYGDESHKPIFGDDVWVDLALPVEGYYTGRAIVFTDVRFYSEHTRIKELGGTIIRINRTQEVEADLHASETQQLSLAADYTIQNDADIAGLYANVERVLSNLGT